MTEMRTAEGMLRNCKARLVWEGLPAGMDLPCKVAEVVDISPYIFFRDSTLPIGVTGLPPAAGAFSIPLPAW